MGRILFVAMHRPDRSPSQRFRFEQYIGYLRQNGFESDYSYLIESAADDKVFYSPGNYLGKMGIFLKSAAKRLGNVLSLSKYDIIFIQREAFMIGTTIFEQIFANSKAKVVFDFDDSIWIQNVTDSNKALLFLKNPNKTGDIIGKSDLIFAGNDYLADYARQFNPNVVVVPTTIDTEEYQREPQPDSDRVCVGWSGSVTTIIYFEEAVPALRLLKAKYGDRVYFKVIGDGDYRNEELGIRGLPWKKDTEVHDLSEIDIGIMPLPDDEWANGKCGLKGLQYMALEIATLMSPVGVNSTIIEDGVNGFLASKPQEWVEKISRLIDNPSLRRVMGRAGRQTVVDHYSVLSERDHYLRLFRELTA